jgi:hypothetical protein
MFHLGTPWFEHTVSPRLTDCMVGSTHGPCIQALLLVGGFRTAMSYFEKSGGEHNRHKYLVRRVTDLKGARIACRVPYGGFLTRPFCSGFSDFLGRRQ